MPPTPCTVVLDLETIGDRKPENADAIDEMAADREKNPAEFAALCPPLARVVAVGLVHLESEKELVYYDDAPFFVPTDVEPRREGPGTYHGESVLLTAVNVVFDRATRFVTFNGRCYDLPVLVHRMVVNGVTPSPKLVAAAREYRYRPNLHIDLRDQFSFFGAASGGGTLRAYAVAYGLADPKANGGGADVAKLVQAGDVDALCRYCLGDVRTTLALYRRWLAGPGLAQ